MAPADQKAVPHRGPAPANLAVAQAFVMALRRHGVTVVFGQSIPSQIHLAAPAHGIAQIAYRTESAGAIMADGYARISGRVGVVTAQNGPAATLLVPGLAEALKASIPILALVQDVAMPALDRNAFQEIDHFDLFRGCCKWVRRIHSADRVDDYVDMAITAASSGRPGPAVLLCPFDVIGASTVGSGERDATLGRYPLDRVLADPQAITRVAEMLATAERPLIVAGGGVNISGAAAELSRLQQMAALPVATTIMGKGAVDEGHPLSLGVIGYFMGTGGMAKFMRPLIEEADLIFFVGTRTNQNGTDSWTLFPRQARFVHLDIDPLEVGRNYESIRLVGDAKLTLAALADSLAARDLGLRQARRAALASRIAAARAAHLAEAVPLLSATTRPIRPERLMGDLARVLTPEAITVADASYASIWVANYLPALRAGMRFLSPRGLAGLGWGFPMALGAKLAAPDRPVFCVVGDGGFAHVWSELETACRHGIKTVVTVLNNQVLAYQKHVEDVLFGAHTSAVDLGPVDHAAIARACGLQGIRIERPEDYLPALEQAIEAERATVIDAIIDPDAYPPVTAFENRLRGRP
ncbi:MAG TPA: acetolactate synthase catalytic subunit [Alphaproteobacteria bacterium]|nr:acetolactate synthase catalytic subunit [Alphaproteobacteria bacterium]